jgi:hypothetical protein
MPAPPHQDPAPLSPPSAALPDEPHSLRAVDAGGDGLLVEFVRLDDRYGHRIWRVEQHVPVAVLLTSQEGTPDRSPPGVPALQTLHFTRQDSGHGEFASLIGSSGHQHWSLSVQADTAGASPALLFDAACRMKHEPTRITTSYRRRATVQEDGPSPPGVLLPRDQPVTVRPLTIDGAASTAEVAADQQTLRIVLDIDAGTQLPATARWRYRVTATARPGG